MPKKSAEKAVTKKTQTHYNKILTYMEADVWYKTVDFIEVLGVKERRVKTLLNDLVKNGWLIEKGFTKGKKYKKTDKK